MTRFDDEELWKEDELHKPQFSKPPLSTKSIIVHTIVATILIMFTLAGLAIVAFVILMAVAFSSYGSSK